jgi:hypothetical protein
MTRRAGESIQPTEATGAAVKRRGILAAAGAVVAGIVAKQASQPVAATSGTGTDGNFVLGSNDLNNTANYASVRTQIISGLNFHGPVLLDCSASPFQSTGDTNAIGVSGISRGSAAGVYGSDYVGSKPAGYPGGMNAGVYGYTYSSGHSGVRGDGGPYGVGVHGNGTNDSGVYGEAAGAAPAVFGHNTSGAASAGPGAQGTSDLGHGTVGVSGASDGHASLYGFSNRQGGITVRGSIDPMVRTAPFTFAGVFDGTVVVSGSLFIGGNKSAYVKHPDGSHRVLYCVESPESWFEDFGEGMLAGGKAEVALDADFAALVDTSKMHVFLTEHDDNHNLHVPRQTAKGFTVQASVAALAARGKQASEVSGKFSYRVVAKRKDIVGERLARFEPPKEMPFDVAKATAPPPPSSAKKP